MISKLQIKNMRCLKDLTLDNLGMITLISGKNNVGKSAILESILLLSTCSSPEFWIRTSAIRGVPLRSFAPELLWEPMFHSRDVSHALEIVCIDDNGAEHSVSFQKDTSFIMPVPQVPLQPEQRLLPDSYPLKVICIENKKEFTGHFIPQVGSLSTHWKPSPRKTDLTVQFISPRSTDHINSIAHIFGKIELAGHKERVVEILRMLDSDIVELSAIQVDNVINIYAKRKDNCLLPLSAMGDGINKLLAIICSILTNKDGIVLIDEIENGFHYSFYDKLWETIAKAAKETNTQIFATTHSYECLQSTEFLAQEKNNKLQPFRYIRLGRENGEIVPHSFSSEAFKFAIESDMEIR